jgi:hypothetical protein
MHVYVCELSFPAANAARERVFACAVSKVDAAAQRGGAVGSVPRSFGNPPPGRATHES